MSLDNIALFKALGSKMHFLNQRQRIISQNVSNSDTPGYQPKDLLPVKFDDVLKDVTNKGNNGVQSVRMETTRGNHIPAPGQIPDAKSREQKQTYEVAPAGNAVVMEEQLIKSNRTVMDYNLMSNLIAKNVGMINTALGRNQG